MLLLKCYTSHARKFGKLSSGHRTRQGQSFITKKGNAKKCSNYHTIALVSHASKVMLKVLQARVQRYVNRKLPDVQIGFRKGRGTRDQIANICCIKENTREFQKNLYFCFIAWAKAFDSVDHNKLENSSRNGHTQTNLPATWETCMQCIKKQRHHFAYKGPSSQSYGFSSSHAWMWELDSPGRLNTKELMPSNYGAGEDSLESPGQQEDQTCQS